MSDTHTQYNLKEILAAEPEVLSRNQLKKARNAALDSGSSLFDSLVGEGIIAEETLLNILSERLGLKKVNLIQEEPDKQVTKLVPAELAVKRCRIPLKVQKDAMLIAVNDPTDYQLLNDISQAIRNLYGLGAEAAERLMA